MVALIERIDAALRREMPAAAATVAVMRHGEIVGVHAVGMADLEQGVRATPDTVYCIGSISKMFAAAAILQLSEQGRLYVDDELTRYVPSFSASGHPITLRQFSVVVCARRRPTCCDSGAHSRAGKSCRPHRSRK